MTALALYDRDMSIWKLKDTDVLNSSYYRIWLKATMIMIGMQATAARSHNITLDKSRSRPEN